MKSTAHEGCKATFIAAIGLWLSLALAPAMAGTSTTNLSSTASVSASCTITTQTVAFGNYDPIVTNASTALTATGAVDTTCTNGAAATITLDQGANAGPGSTASAPVRRMANGTNYLNYGLYTNSSYTTTFDGTTGVAVTGTGAQVATTVYGSVPAGQNSLPSGSYSDTVVATVTF
jgi:spore coat protein U-like protein